MQKRCEAYFRIEQVVSLELLKKVEHDEAQLFFGLHEGNASRSSCQEIGKVGTLRGRDKIVLVCFFCDRRVDPVDDVVAQ
jgi:hypothetical protein